MLIVDLFDNFDNQDSYPRSVIRRKMTSMMQMNATSFSAP